VDDAVEARVVAELVADGVLRVEDGNHGEYRPRPHEFTSGGTPYIRAADMSSGVVDFATAEQINDEARARVRKGIGMDQDTLLSHKGTVGKVAYVPLGSPAFVCSPQTTFWRSLDHGRLDPRYLNLVLRSQGFQAQLDLMKSSTDMAPYVSLTQQRSLLLSLHSIEQQRAIASVLGALDDKIAANTRIAVVADELLRARWHALAEDADETRRLGDIAEVVRSQIDPGRVPEDLSYVGLEHIPRRCMWLSEFGTASAVTSAKSRFASGDVLFGKLRPYFHKVAAAPVDGICSTDILVLRARSSELAGLLLSVAASDDIIARATAASEGTRMPRASWKDLATAPVPWPGDEEARAFSEHATRIRLAVEARLTENATLTASHDALLPALMSGRLRVREAEQLAENLT